MSNAKLDKAIREEDWHTVAELIDEDIRKRKLDVWYGYTPLTTAVHDAGYQCYTCFMKYHGVLESDYICYLGYNGSLGKHMRESYCSKEEISNVE